MTLGDHIHGIQSAIGSADLETATRLALDLRNRVEFFGLADVDLADTYGREPGQTEQEPVSAG